MDELKLAEYFIERNSVRQVLLEGDNIIQDIRYDDIVNGEGIRVSVWVSGCCFRCPGCFNKEAWEYNSGRPFTDKDLKDIMDYLNNPLIDGITILGGEPLAIPYHFNNEKVFSDENLFAIKNNTLTLRPFNKNNALTMFLCSIAKELGKSAWVYTGATYEELMKHERIYKPVLELIDVLVDGRFEEDKKDLSLAFRGSRNQRLLHLKNGEIVHDI